MLSQNQDPKVIYEDSRVPRISVGANHQLPHCLHTLSLNTW